MKTRCRCRKADIEGKTGGTRENQNSQDEVRIPKKNEERKSGNMNREKKAPISLRDGEGPAFSIRLGGGAGGKTREITDWE